MAKKKTSEIEYTGKELKRGKPDDKDIDNVSIRAKFAKILGINKDDIFSVEEGKIYYRIGSYDCSTKREGQMVATCRLSRKNGKNPEDFQGYSYTHVFKSAAIQEQGLRECIRYAKQLYSRKYYVGSDGIRVQVYKDSIFFYHYIAK